MKFSLKFGEGEWIDSQPASQLTWGGNFVSCLVSLINTCIVLLVSFYTVALHFLSCVSLFPFTNLGIIDVTPAGRFMD